MADPTSKATSAASADPARAKQGRPARPQVSNGDQSAGPSTMTSPQSRPSGTAVSAPSPSAGPASNGNDKGKGVAKNSEKDKREKKGGSVPTPAPAQPQSQSQSPSQGQGGAKSAKDLKKEKRAAAVAARGGPSGRPGGPDEQAGSGFGEGGAGAGDSRPSARRAGSGAISSSTTTGAGASSHPWSAHVPLQPKRPHPLTTDASYAPAPASQTLFFSHIPVLHQPSTTAAVAGGAIHPLVLRLGVLMASGQLRGRNARTKGMLLAFQHVIDEYESPENALLWKDLSGHLSPMIAWLEECRPKGAGGGNAIRWLKGEINKFGDENEDRTEAEQKAYLCEAIGMYIRDRIDLAGQMISREIRQKIQPGSVIVTYARSSVVEQCLIDARKEMQRDKQASFEVIVVDSAPLFEGRLLAQSLQSHSIPLTYTLLPTLSALLPRADLVLLGASAVYANGSMTSRAGSALVAMLAKEVGVPVLVAVETYKFSDDTRLDGLGLNEIDFEWMDRGKSQGSVELAEGAEDGVQGDVKAKGTKGLTRLALSYDMTPADHILSLCTEPVDSLSKLLSKWESAG